jgi:WD40 repeat protein
MSGLDMTSYAGFQAGGLKGPSFVAGSPETSLTIKLMTGEVKPQMPFGQPALSPADIAVVKEWIKAGAADDTPAAELATGPTVYRQPSVITALRYSPDSQTLAVSGNREVLLHKADGSGLVRRLAGKSERILSIAYSKDGNLLVAGGGTPARFGEVQWWNPGTGELLRTAEATTDTVFGASLSPDAAKVAVGCADNTARVFDSATAKELYKLSNHEDWVLATVFGVDSKRIVSVGRDRAAKLVSAADGRFIENVNQLAGELSAVARHPLKDEIVIGGIERYPYVYRLDRPRNMKVGEDATLIRKMERQDGTIFALGWSPDGKQIAVGGSAPEVTLYNAGTGERMGACKGHSAGIYALDYSPDGRRLATGGFDGTVRIYDPGDCSLVKSFVPAPIGGN